MSRPAWGKAGGSQTSGSQTGASQAGRSQEAGPSGGGLRKPKPERGQRQVDEVAEQLAGVRIERPSTGQAAGTEIIRKKFDKYAKRPGYGTAGRKIKLLSNFFKITFGKNVSLSAYHYDLTISKVHAGAEGVEGDTTEREIVSKTLKRKLFLQWTFENNSIASKRPAFDGEKNFFTLVAVTPEAGRSTVVLKEEGSRDSTFVLKYKYVNHYVNITDCAPLSEDALQALDIILGYGSASQMIPIKSSVYFKSGEGPPRMKFATTRDNQGDLGTNFEMAFGWYKSARYVENGLMINLDRAVTVFQEGGFLLEIIQRIYGKGSASKFENNEYWVPTLLEEIKGLKIRVVFPPQCRVPYSRTYLIDGLGRTPQEEKFEWNRMVNDKPVTEMVSVATYYFKQYQLHLKYPKLPCIVSKDRRIPMELCQLVPDQMLRKKLADRLKAQVTKMAVQKPDIRLRGIKDSILKLQQHARELISCNIDVQPQEVEARVIKPPLIAYFNGVEVDPSKEKQCAWNLTNKKFVDARKMDNWYIVQVEPVNPRWAIPNEFMIRTFAESLMKKGSQLGMDIAKPRGGTILKYRSVNDVYVCFDKITKEKSGLQLIVVIIPELPGVYNAVKLVGNTTGVATQCVRSKHYNGRDVAKSKMVDHSYLENLLQKINGKLGGINMHLKKVVDMPPILQKPCMIIGLDVSHPSPGDTVPQSIAAVVCSYTATFVQYMSGTNIQPKGRDEIVNLKGVVVKFLRAFFTRNKRYPLSILVFRDGVSRGQFDHVMACEVNDIHEAIKEAGEGCSPKLTFVTVQKRHNVRFFEKSNDPKTPSPYNIAPGTVVDKGVVDKSLFDFYLCSHYALLGTAKPAHYACLYDENNLDADTLQKICFYLCFICARCPKPISIPVPVKYAHLAAEKAKAHLDALYTARRERTSDAIKAHDDLTGFNFALPAKLYYV